MQSYQISCVWVTRACCCINVHLSFSDRPRVLFHAGASQRKVPSALPHGPGLRLPVSFAWCGWWMVINLSPLS